MFLGSKARQVRRLTILRPSVSRMSRQCGILNISQPTGLHGQLGGWLLTLLQSTAKHLARRQERRKEDDYCASICCSPTLSELTTWSLTLVPLCSYQWAVKQLTVTRNIQRVFLPGSPCWFVSWGPRTPCCQLLSSLSPSKLHTSISRGSTRSLAWK
jgi:hypothetical protein